MSRKIYNNRDKGGAYMSNGIYSEIKKRIEQNGRIITKEELMKILVANT